MLLQAEDRMNPERLGQLQHYIGSAREKQERWKSRVQGGNLFKKNQVPDRSAFDCQSLR